MSLSLRFILGLIGCADICSFRCIYRDRRYNRCGCRYTVQHAHSQMLVCGWFRLRVRGCRGFRRSIKYNTVNPLVCSIHVDPTHPPHSQLISVHSLLKPLSINACAPWMHSLQSCNPYYTSDSECHPCNTPHLCVCNPGSSTQSKYTRSQTPRSCTYY